MGIFSSLSREQKEAVGLLQIGTFLEYFDLMLYVHMAVLLNELFFPKTDPHTAALLSAFAFCSTYMLRPFGALLFGWIGDNIGRKSTVIITTLMMSVSCAIMANLPTYAQIGITATWLVTICRIAQGLSSMGEIMGAQIYMTEITSPPVQYPAVSLIRIASSIGTVFALAIASLVTHFGLNWRIAFWVGAGIAVVGSIARTRLRETPEFVDMKRRRQKEIEESNFDETTKLSEINKIKNQIKKTKINKKDLIAYFFIYCGWPLFFYLVYIYFNPILKGMCGYSPEDIIVHNLWLSMFGLVYDAVLVFISYKVHPLTILRIRTQGLLLLIIVLPFLIIHSTNHMQIFALQILTIFFTLCSLPADAVFIKNFPTLRRFTCTSIVYASARAVMHIITAFGLVYLTESFGHYGLWLIMPPVAIGFLWGVNHFEKLEKTSDKFHTQEKPSLPLTA